MNLPVPVKISSLPKMDSWDILYQQLLNQTKTRNSLMGSNFKINDESGIWDSLYEKFLVKSQELLGPFTVLENNSRACWCYASNATDYLSCIHEHSNTSVINGVYYFSMPSTDNDRDGALAFYDNNDSEICYYKPKEEDLVIMPGILRHQPLPVYSKQYRFSINMEIKCSPIDISKFFMQD